MGYRGLRDRGGGFTGGVGDEEVGGSNIGDRGGGVKVGREGGGGTGLRGGGRKKERECGRKMGGCRMRSQDSSEEREVFGEARGAKDKD